MRAITVAELIRALQEYPPETRVEARDSEGNFTLGANVSWKPLDRAAYPPRGASILLEG